MLRVDSVERYPHAHAVASRGVVDEDEFALARFGDVAEERAIVIFFRFGAGGDGVGLTMTTHGHAIMMGWDHGGAAYIRIGRVAAWIAGENMALSDIIVG